MRDFYSILSLPRTATAVEVKTRFRELARERHPDRFQGEDKARAEEEFQTIAEAFNTLSDPTRRRQHDLELDRPAQTEYDPRHIEKVYLSRGARAYKQGNFLDAADNFDRATQAAPGNAQAWHHLALASSHEKHWLPKAQEAIERACQLAPDNATYQKLAGKIFAQSGMTVRAKQYYNHALRLGGPDPAVRKALAALEPTAGGVPDATDPVAVRPGRESEASGQEKSSLFRKLW